MNLWGFSVDMLDELDLALDEFDPATAPHAEGKPPELLLPDVVASHRRRRPGARDRGAGQQPLHRDHAPRRPPARPRHRRRGTTGSPPARDPDPSAGPGSRGRPAPRRGRGRRRRRGALDRADRRPPATTSRTRRRSSSPSSPPGSPCARPRAPSRSAGTGRRSSPRSRTPIAVFLVTVAVASLADLPARAPDRRARRPRRPRRRRRPRRQRARRRAAPRRVGGPEFPSRRAALRRRTPRGPRRHGGGRRHLARRAASPASTPPCRCSSPS